jgi:predicted DNA-binding transcriptional regulator YafY
VTVKKRPEATRQFDRIVSLVAELSRQGAESDLSGSEGEGDYGPKGRSLGQLAREFGVTPQQIAADIRTLTLLGDHSDAEWLLSLSVWQQEDRVSVVSRGPFRRPLRFTPDELLAVQLALAMDPDGAAVAAKLNLPASPGQAAPPERPVRPGPAADLLSEAARHHRRVELLYAGEGERFGTRWVVEPHQLVGYRGRTYIVAWTGDATGWRHFRVDRVIDALDAGTTFTPREDFLPVLEPADLFRASDDAVDEVTVRFSPRVARWVRERYGAHQVAPDGSVLVTLRASGVDWLVRRVLEYGAEAEVVSPASYRAAMQRAVA